MVESIGKGNDLEILEYNKNLGGGMSQELVNSVYYYYHVDFGIKLDIAIEMTEQEFRSLALESGTYNFWNVPEEDIYSINDGEPV